MTTTGARALLLIALGGCGTMATTAEDAGADGAMSVDQSGSSDDLTVSPTADLTVSPTADLTVSPTADLTMSPTADLTMSPTADLKTSPPSDLTVSPTADLTTSPTADLKATQDLKTPGQDLATLADLTTSSGDLVPWSFSETFPGVDGSPWGSRWKVLGGVATSTIVGGRGRLTPIASNYSLARVGTTEGLRDIEVSYRVLFEQIGTQGVGFYVRSNGGWLQGTTPHGQGYAVFVEGFRGSRMGVWTEIDGVETELTNTTNFATPLQSNVLYGVRFHVRQINQTTTQLQARIWIASQAEPSTWQIDTTDSTPVLQNITGGMAIDSWSTTQSGTITVGTQVDDVLAGPG